MCRCEDSNSIAWIRDVLQQCVSSPAQVASFILGFCSIFSWLCAQFPQVVKNYRKKSADALSWVFLLEWLIGDGTNLLGTILTQQLSTQIATAIYFVCMDVVLGGQYLYYRFRNRRMRAEPIQTPVSARDDEERGNAKTDHQALLGDDDQLLPSPSSSQRLLSPLGLFFGILLLHRSFFSSDPEVSSVSISSSHRILLSSDPSELLCGENPPGTEWRVTTGYWIGWVSAAFYLGSRIPQIWKNYKRQSTQGLACGLFFFAVLGNLTYGFSVVIYGGNLDGSIPWLVGSFGCLVFDFTMWVYRRRRIFEQEPPSALMSIDILPGPIHLSGSLDVVANLPDPKESPVEPFRGSF